MELDVQSRQLEEFITEKSSRQPQPSNDEVWRGVVSGQRRGKGRKNESRSYCLPLFPSLPALPRPSPPPVQHTEGESDEATVHCATCGVHVSVRKALGHMERCFMKVCAGCGTSACVRGRVECEGLGWCA